MKVYPDVLELLDILTAQGCELALASRTGEPDWARELLALLGLTNTFRHQAIYPSDKPRPFQQLHKESGFEYHEMLFFDDEKRNIDSVSQLGVHTHYVSRGVRREDFDFALCNWRRSVSA